jgi:hypothetical protein
MVLASFVAGLVSCVGARLRLLAASRPALDAAVDLPAITPPADVKDGSATRAYRLP